MAITPLAPTNVQASKGNYANEISLTWDTLGCNADEFIIYRDKDSIYTTIHNYYIDNLAACRLIEYKVFSLKNVCRSITYNSDIGYLTNCIFTEIQTESTKELRVFPNPVKEFMIFDLEDYITEISGIEIFNVYGERLLYLCSSEINKLTNINISNFIPGVYFYSIILKKNKITDRFIITK